MNLQDINIIEINPYSFQFQVLIDCTTQDLMEVFHISKRRWNQNTIRNNKSHTNIYPKNSICTIDFMIPEQIEIQDQSVKVLYEDLYIIAVYKPPFLLVHEDGNQQNNLQNRVNSYLQENGWPYPSQALHRIDYEASGIVIFSKFPFFQGLFDELIESHDCIKEYYAKVEGTVPFKKKTIDQPISRNRHNAKAMIINKNGKRSISHVERLEVKNNTTLCKVRIETGRKHQIRVHLSSNGYPIINDPIYGTIKNKKGLLLENFHMKFKHPVTNEIIDIEIQKDERF